MLTELQNNIISDKVYLLDSSRKDYESSFKEYPVLKYDDELDIGSYKIIKVEDNQENGMQAMAVAPIGTDGQPDYSQITIVYAGTNFSDPNDTGTDLQMLGYGDTKELNRYEGEYASRKVESQAVTALRFAEEIRKQYRNAQITTTGHSLGESLAIYVALKNGWDNMGSHGPDIHNMITHEDLA